MDGWLTPDELGRLRRSMGNRLAFDTVVGNGEMGKLLRMAEWARTMYEVRAREAKEAAEVVAARALELER